MSRAEDMDPSVFVKVGNDPDGFRPYDFQDRATESLSRYFDPQTRRKGEVGKAGVLVVPTGGGKTSISSRWSLKEIVRNGGRVLWLAHRRALLRQAFRTYLSNRALLLGAKDQLGLIRISSSDKSWSQVEPAHDVVFASIQSTSRATSIRFARQMHEQSPNGLFVIVDEAHHAAAPSYYRLLTELKGLGCQVLGLTATPVRTSDADTKVLMHLFDSKVIYQIRPGELVSKRVLSRPNPETVPTKIDFEADFEAADFEHLRRFGELSTKVLRRLAQHASRNKLIVDHYVGRKDRYGKTILFCADVLHARTLAQEFTNAGISADFVDYQREDNAKILEDFRNDRGPEVLANVEMLTEGYDAPKTKTVFIARPTRSEALMSQMIGRALRGPLSGGTEDAYLVTFVDTWKYFHPLQADYDFHEVGEVAEPVTVEAEAYQAVEIPQELINEAYAIIQAHAMVQGELKFESMPHAWFFWQEEFDDDIQRRFVLVFDHHSEEFQALRKRFEHAPEAAPSEDIPTTREAVQLLLAELFQDTKDPQPNWLDVQGLLQAWSRGDLVHYQTLHEREIYEPKVIAQRAFDEDLGPRKLTELLKSQFDEYPNCKALYRGDLEAYQEDVQAEIRRLTRQTEGAPKELETLLPEQIQLEKWAPADPGYRLDEIRDVVLAERRHFPRGVPRIGDLRYSTHPMMDSWGFYRGTDRTIVINRILDSPTVPRFVLEYLLYHEMLHAEMPGAGHDKEFRERERRFRPSKEALEDARKRGIQVEETSEGWSARGDQYLDTVGLRLVGGPGTEMKY